MGQTAAAALSAHCCRLPALAMVIAADVTDFKQRWMPLTAIAPMALYVWRPALLEPGVGRMFTNFVIVFALIFLTMATLRFLREQPQNDPDELNHPVKELAQQLRGAGYTGNGVIVGSDHDRSHAAFTIPSKLCTWLRKWRTAAAMPISSQG